MEPTDDSGKAVLDRDGSARCPWPAPLGTRVSGDLRRGSPGSPPARCGELGRGELTRGLAVRLDPGEKVADVEGFPERAEHPRINVGLRRVWVSGDDKHPEVLRPRALTESTKEFPTIDTGHHQVQEDETRPRHRGELRQRFATIFGRYNLTARPLQNVCDGIAEIHIIIHQEHEVRSRVRHGPQ